MMLAGVVRSFQTLSAVGFRTISTVIGLFLFKNSFEIFVAVLLRVIIIQNKNDNYLLVYCN